MGLLLQKEFFILAGIFVLGSIGSLLFRRNNNMANWWANSCAALGSLFGILLSGNVLLYNNIYTLQLPLTFSLLPVNVKIDMLSAFFILIISVVSLLSSIYAIGYMRQFYKEYNLGLFGFFYNFFILSMILVASANNALYFLFVWEIMSLTSYFLVIFEHKHKESIKAGFLYFIMTHIATGGILLAFLILYSFLGSFDFDVIRENVSSLPSFWISIVSLLMLAGFGTKAGIIPLHIWLPKAHPAAPSQVSAIMSGVMIKTGILMLIRLFFDVIPITPLWFGLLIIIVGAISSLLGVLYAISEHDIKKLLAYHSVENIGIILLGVGSSLVFLSFDLKSLALLALVAALFHTMNHAIFKSLLFLGAGSVVLATRTRNIEEYGGLIKIMPQTALFFLVGAISISALPPFNGFVSEWLTFQALFLGVMQFDIFTKGVFIFGIASLALTGGLAAACFVKAFGITFLAKPRSQKSENAKESSLLLRLPMAVLSLACLALGVFSIFVIPYLESLAGSLSIFAGISLVLVEGITFHTQNNSSSLAIIPVLIALLLTFVFSFIFFNWISRRQKEKIYSTWDCGGNLTPRMEITATSFSRSIVMIFSGILKPTKQINREYDDSNIKYFTKSSTVSLRMNDLYNKYLYCPISNFVYKIANFLRRIQCGIVNFYLLYILITIVILLILVTR
ncbi:hydrogenase 4 subunit B [Patescibacteria group bacterium]|nr:hydrogenase 4 subunit B [Patescibacteria group bacterium]